MTIVCLETWLPESLGANLRALLLRNDWNFLLLSRVIDVVFVLFGPQYFPSIGLVLVKQWFASGPVCVELPSWVHGL